MTDTYAQVMRPADEPENGRTTRSRAPRRSGVAPGTSAAADGAEAARDSPPTPIGASRKPAGKPRTPRTPKTSAKKPRTSGTTGEVPASTAQPLGRATPRTPGVPVQAPDSTAEETFAAAAAAFMAGRDAQVRSDLQFEDVPAPKRLAPYATAIAATVQRDDADIAWGPTSVPKWNRKSRRTRSLARSAGVGCQRPWTHTYPAMRYLAARSPGSLPKVSARSGTSFR